MRSTDRPYGVVTESAGRGAVYEGHGPQAVYAAESDETYVVYRGPEADPYATVYDHGTGTFAEPTRIGENPLSSAANHGPPSTCIVEGPLLAFWGSHTDPHQVARSREPYDVTAWDDVGPMDEVPPGTYPNPVVLDDDVYVLYRAGPGARSPEYPSARFGTIVRSIDDGQTFEDLGPVLDATDHPDEVSIMYVKDLSVHEGRLHMSWFICHDHAEPWTAASQHRSGIYHAIYAPGDGTCYDVAGDRYEPPLTYEDVRGSPIEALDRTNVNHPKHVVTGEGPTILYTHHDPPSLPSNDAEPSRVEWLVSSWEGRWRTERIPGAFATHLFDGGYPRINEDGEFEAHIITGGTDADLVDGSRGGVFEVARRTDDGWDRRTVATAADAGDPLSRVTTVKDGTDEFASLFVPASDDPTDIDLPLYAYGTRWADAGGDA